MCYSMEWLAHGRSCTIQPDLEAKIRLPFQSLSYGQKHTSHTKNYPARKDNRMELLYAFGATLAFFMFVCLVTILIIFDLPKKGGK